MVSARLSICKFSELFQSTDGLMLTGSYASNTKKPKIILRGEVMKVIPMPHYLLSSENSPHWQ